MTIKKLETLKTGTIVMWRREFADSIESESGRVINEMAQSRNGRLFIQWDGGQITDGRDDGALQYVCEWEGASPRPEASHV